MDMMDLMQAQYQYVKEARMVLFDYCKTIPAADLLREHSSFGRGGSMRNLMVHNANVYEFWIGQQTFKEAYPLTAYESVADITALIRLYEQADHLAGRLITLAGTGTSAVTCERKGSMVEIPILKLFTHVITHEFHHKGQVLSISRMLGYTPADTDVIH